MTSSGDGKESDRSECSETDYGTESDTEDEIDPWAPLIEEVEQRNLTEYNETLHFWNYRCRWVKGKVCGLRVQNYTLICKAFHLHQKRDEGIEAQTPTMPHF